MSMSELKQAIEKYHRANSDSRLVDTAYVINLRAEAWRVAFEWRDGMDCEGRDYGELQEGISLIREKLRT